MVTRKGANCKKLLHQSSYEASQLSVDVATRLPPPLPKPLPPPPFSRRKQLHRRGASDGSVLALFPDVRHSQSLGDLIQPTLPSPPVNLQTTPPVPFFSYPAAPLNSKFSGPATQPRPVLEFLDGSGVPAACTAEPCMLDADLFGAAFDAIRSEAKGLSTS
ncbi:unnamed protein product [Dibothriocephalus latus]|uniref:Uncharacterized protein n=1 Tax=Dibothriocephalus latus TaxID=60516 RepID=A0A3P7MAJ9_DIBLA|nr:unnamed protein product [Dibothriocephalus latus]